MWTLRRLLERVYDRSSAGRHDQLHASFDTLVLWERQSLVRVRTTVTSSKSGVFGIHIIQQKWVLISGSDFIDFARAAPAVLAAAGGSKSVFFSGY